MSSYIELHAASAFSFLQGASLPETLVERAADLEYPALALLDRDGVYGAPRFHKAATAAGIKPIIGAELTIQNLELKTDLTSRFVLPVLCESQEGYRNLCRLITRMKLRAPKGEGVLTLEDLDGHTAGLVALGGRAALDTRGFGVGLLDRLLGLFGQDRFYVELQRHHRRDEAMDNRTLIGMAAAFRVPLIATGGVRYAAPGARPLFDVLTCIHHHTDLARAGRRLAPNAERYLKPAEDMAALFRDLPDAVAETRALADRLQFTMADLGYRFPEYPVPPGESQASFLRQVTDAGARDRYRPYHDRARAQIARELDLIEKLELAGYFLIVWDIVNFCRQQDILVQGRGSAANSAVCYSLGITAVDPVGMELLFERFLSEERGEWPDIDLDLPSGDRRERVIQHVYEKYNARGAASEGPKVGMTANVITYRGKSAAREVGKALGLDPVQIDRLAKVMNNFEFRDPADTLPGHLAAVGLDLHADRVQLFARLWDEMQDLPRHLGQHSGGMVICQGQLDACVPLENASMPGRVVVQWDKDDCADMGIVKVDLLGLGMMAVLQDALTLVNGEVDLRRPVLDMPEHNGARASGMGVGPHASKESKTPSPAADDHSSMPVGPHPHALKTSASSVDSRPRVIDLAHLPENDPAVYKMLQEADTIGVFQVESRAQMATLPRLKPTCFYDLVVEVAIIRPGPIVGQMVHPYLNRRSGKEPVVPLHPSLEPVLARTLGVPLFQEQLLRMAMVAAGFTGGQAEDLRRAMGFKRSEKRMKQIEGQLREGMARNGITGETAERIITSIASFALYGFPESHAASFALLAYASAYLKAHFPAAFYTALLNNQPMGFYHPSTLVKDAQRRGIRFQPIDVQVSDWDCTVEQDGSIRLGLRYVSGLRQEAGKKIASVQLRRPVLDTRERHGASASGLGVGPQPDTRGRESTLEPEEERSRASAWGWGPTRSKERWQDDEPSRCPKCGCDDESMLEQVNDRRWFCNNCSHDWPPASRSASREVRSAGRFKSLDDLIARTGLRRDEVVTLADIGALNSFGYDRRSALWQAERAVRPSGELFTTSDASTYNAEGVYNAEGACGYAPHASDSEAWEASASGGGAPRERVGVGPHALGKNDDGDQLPKKPAYGEEATDTCPLRPMTEAERLVADYAGMGLSIGRHPMALRRDELAMRGILRAIDLHAVRQGRRVRVAGMVITRQRPGTAKGFVFLTLEDETGIANIIVRPDLFARDRLVIIEEPFLIVDGILQNQEGVTSVRAEAVRRMRGIDVDFDAHDFY